MIYNMKKILFISQYFYPEVFRGNDIAFHWAEDGHEVHVVTGIPNYPAGKFYDGYGLLKRRKELVNGVRVTRLPIVPRGNNKIMLMLNYFSFLVVAWVYVLFHTIRHRYDCVFVQQLSPVMMSAPGVLYKQLRGVPLYTWVLDLWPESLTAAGGINNKWVLAFFRHFVKREYKYSDKILMSSRSFERSVLEYGDYKDKLVYFPQWADGTDSLELGGESMEVIKDVRLPKGFKLMFAGAVGEAHGFESTMHAALLTKEHRDIKWVIVGEGRRLDWVRNFVKENGLGETVMTLGRFPANTMPWFFQQADVMLVTLNDDPLFRLYAPAKISSYMSASKPILAVLNGEGAEVVRDADCGWTLSAGDADGMARIAIELSQTDKTIMEEKGRNAAAYYKEHFVKERCLARLDDVMGLVGCAARG